MEYEFTVVVERDEDGVYIVTVPALPGCNTAGDTEEEALELIKDAMRLNIEARLEVGDPIPEDIASERVRVAV
jgi:antitoxin HicB